MLKNRFKQLALATFVLLFATLIALILIYAQKEVEKKEPQIASTLVTTIPLKKEDVAISLFGYGTIEPNRLLTLRSEVSGRVDYVSENLDEGTIVLPGELLVQIDPRDYQNSVEQQLAQVEQAEFELKLESGRQRVAKREWELIGNSIDKADISEELALRKPHLKEKEAALKAAKSRLEKAKLDLKRTSIKAPFQAVVLEEEAEVGEVINPQSKIARLAATDQFVIQVNLPYEKLRWIDFARGERKIPATIIQEIGDGISFKREGYVLRLLKDLDPNGRLARLLVAIDDPLGLKSACAPLLLDSYVQVEIHGPTIPQVFVIPRSALREGDRLFIMKEDNTLDIRPVKVLYRKKDEIVIENDLKNGEKLITSTISTPLPGMKLRSKR